MDKCSVADCGKPRVNSVSPYCGMHYMRMRRYGRLHLIRRPNGTGNINAGGYVDKNDGKRRRYEHVEVAEAALGRPLPKGAKVHHVNENKSDNRPSNLVICPSEAYHQLLHSRMRARARGESG